MPQKSLLLRVPEAAEELGVSVRSIYRLVAAGDIPATPIGSGKRQRLRISREALVAYVKRQTRDN